jgi:leader peptidase (prepilin peptidase)/N-methyltransferase
MEYLLNAFIVALGAVVGSFLNVCIHRVPEGRSIVSPSSACPGCGNPIRPRDNVPILSYLFLKGKCRYCGRKISPRYLAVELITALVALLIFLRYGLSLPFLSVFAFASALIVITFIDLEHGIIPDVITLPGIPVFLLLAVLVMGVPLLDSIIGAVAGGGILYLIALGYELLTKREGMGGGDIKLLAMLGAFFGWQSLYFILFVSSVLGGLVGIAIMIFRGKDLKYAVPFGPFLSFAAVAYIFFGSDFWSWMGLAY